MTDKIPHQAPSAAAGLTPSQQRAIERARELLAAIDGDRETLTAHVVAVAEHSYEITGLTLSDRRREAMTANPYPEATGHASVTIRDLLEVIDGLTGGAS